MPITDPFPLNISEKEDSPALVAWLAQYGHDKYVNAEDINKIVIALAYLRENLGSGGGSTPNWAQVLTIGGREINYIDTSSGEYTMVLADKKKYLITDGDNELNINIPEGLFSSGDEVPVFTPGAKVTFVTDINLIHNNSVLNSGCKANLCFGTVEAAPFLLITFENDYVDTSFKIRAGSFTAEENGYYKTNGVGTVSDPSSASSGGIYSVLVFNGVTTIGGVAYTEGSLIYRIYDGVSAWTSFLINVSAAEKTKLSYITITQAVNLDDLETRVNELDAVVVLKGVWDASAGTFPASGLAQAGWSYLVTVDGTVDGIEFKNGDRIIAVTDNASATVYASNWYKADYTDRVNTVAGRTGNVIITSADLSDFNSAVNALIATGITGKQDTLTDVTFGAFSNALGIESTVTDSDFGTFVDVSDGNKQKKIGYIDLWANYLRSKVNSLLLSRTIKSTNPSSAVGGVNVETLLQTIAIPSGFSAVDDIDWLIFRIQKTGVVGAATVRIRLSQTDYAASTIIATLTLSASTRAQEMTRKLSHRTGNIVALYPSTINAASELTVANADEFTMSYTAASSGNLYITVQPISVADSFVCSMYSYSKL